MRVPILPIVLFFTFLILTTIIGFKFVTEDGHSDFSAENVSIYLPGKQFQTAKCDNLTVLGQYYDSGDSYYYCIVYVEKNSIKYVDLVMDAYQNIHYAYFSLYNDKVELNDILLIWPTNTFKHSKFRLYGYISYDNIRITSKLRDNGIGYSIISVVIHSNKEVLKNV